MVAVLLTFQHLMSVVNLLGDGITHSHTHTHTHKSESQDVRSKNYKSLTNVSITYFITYFICCIDIYILLICIVNNVYMLRM